MENLNDVEFGSDENQEEAPILIAQRHLNIFRQVHIFNKAKRDQFDDELLALPDVVINYIKKMPGGRLLIEHLEDVKTKRGISFVKSNSSDFIAPDDTAPAVPTAAEVPAQYVGGSVTMDASFAETFAKSMAEAFKQMPAPTITASGTVGGASLPADFGQLIEAIMEEIRASRASLLDVLKETRNITDSVIASQVSISRILEGILSSQNKGDTDTATMNNRIIASQASITKLLENLYTSNTQKNNEISSYLDVENKLQDFRDKLENTINNSLTSIVNHIYDAANKQMADTAELDFENKLARYKAEIEADISKSLSRVLMENISHYSNTVTPQVSNANVSISHNDVDIKDDVIEDTTDVVSAFDNAVNERKKKKKKKKKDQQNINSLSSVIATSAADDNVSGSRVEIVNDDRHQIDGIIRNSQYKHEDTFDNVNLDIPPLDNDETTDLDLPEIASASEDTLDTEFSQSLNTSNLSAINATDEEQNHDVADTDLSSLDDLMDDGLEFELPEQGSALSNEDVETAADEEVSDLSSLGNLMSDDLDFELPEQGSALNGENSEVSAVEESTSPLDDLSSLDGLMSDDTNNEEISQNFDEVADDTEPEVEESTSPLDDLSSLDGLMSDDTNNEEISQDFDEVADDTESEVEESTSPLDDLSSLDGLMSDDTKSEEISQSFDDVTDDTESEVEESTSPLDDLSSLDGLMSDDANSEEISQDFDEVADDTEPKVEESTSSLDDLSSLDGLMSDDTKSEEISQSFDDVTDEVPTTSNEAPSRYSAELDKIRAALTSDNIDISSLDKPIALDDYDDDENISEEDDDISTSDYQTPAAPTLTPEVATETSDTAQSNEDWEWEYVDENGNPVPTDENGTDDQDWEWEYVEDDSSDTEDNNKSE